MLGKLSSILIPWIGEQHLLFASLIIESGKNCPPVTGTPGILWSEISWDFPRMEETALSAVSAVSAGNGWVTANSELRLAGPAFSGDLVASFRWPPGLWGPGVYWTSWTPQNMAVFICFHGEMKKHWIWGAANISHIRKTSQVSAPFLSALQLPNGLNLRRALRWDNCGQQPRSRPLRPHHAVGDSGGSTGGQGQRIKVY